MEDISTLIWLGVVIVWFLARLIRRGARKAAGSQKSPRQPQRPATAPEPRPDRFEHRPDFSGRGGTGPPPIVPR